MNEAIFGLIGVLVGSGISWFQSHWTSKKESEKSARYLAIRVVCLLDKYMEECAEVVKDDGLFEGKRSKQGCLEPQVKIPKFPNYPEDVDWKSIDHNIMFELLSFPAEIEDGNRMIDATEIISMAPNYQDWFDERRFYYCQFGLIAYKLSDKLSKNYGIKKKKYNDWDPVKDFSAELRAVATRRNHRTEEHKAFVKRVLG
ncbi:hypothetical protein IX39_08945 [Chryseobacterium formosense]|uniref:Uncharacterized protein n=1 Tax=Chryseobacterium formosense TaxID=236814 RepID=A0A085Z8H0_9FLAO|nr:hypothetical protein [Chryseobacterium formosense]KFF00734.1 hypothetical protein IX39_08945 [Chryseobacterium formosense]SFT37256.1 hypothetical protein SAMN05421857_0483 [Chryseobacterium formosense]